MKVLRYEDSLADLTELGVPTVFLAGPTVRGNQLHLTSWRPDAIDIFAELNFPGIIVIPEFTERTESDKGKLWIPKWEFAGLTGVDAIMFWIPRTKELIGLTTNHEQGYWLGKRPQKCVYGRPPESYRNTYNDIMIEIEAVQSERYPNPIYDTLRETVAATIRVATYEMGKWREKSKVLVESPYGGF
jgi:hypothetical protein